MDNKVTDTILDVIVRFREHDQYGSEDKALRAFRRRCANLSPEKAQEIFHFYDQLLASTIQAAKTALIVPRRGLSNQTDVLFAAILASLRKFYPDEPEKTINAFISWVIFWHILK